MNNSLEILEWDSSFFGYPVAKITASAITAGELKLLIATAKQRELKLIYIFTNPSDVIAADAAKACSAKLVDQKITFHRKIEALNIPETDTHIKEFESAIPSEQLINLSMQSGLYSRYKIDTNFKKREFERMYLAWIENSVNKKIADHTFVYEENGKELGFVTLKARNNHGQIGLIAVDEKSRGKAIGKKLITAVVNCLAEKKIPELDVATQVDNEDACNFYKKTGFSESKAENIYHIWL
ncbi:dTDP-4-amino-4,6-dideoxy-D-galactose acyltransferase [soil metagenome]